MNEGDFIPQTELDFYLRKPLNMDIYCDIDASKNWKEEYEPLRFFNLLYEYFELAQKNSDKPVAIWNHMLGQGLNHRELFVLLFFLQYLLNHKADCELNRDEQLLVCRRFLAEQYNKLYNEFRPLDFSEFQIGFNYHKISRYLKTLPDNECKLKYLMVKLEEYKDPYHWGHFKNDPDSEFILTPFVDSIEGEISVIRKQMGLDQSSVMQGDIVTQSSDSGNTRLDKTPPVNEQEQIYGGLPSNYSEEQLRKIFDGFIAKEIVKIGDRSKFVSFFTATPQQGKVYWNDSIRPAKAALYSLMETITEKKFVPSVLQRYFNTETPIIRKWRDKNGKASTLVSDILLGI